MATFPPDQFDELPADLSRVGAHRAPPRPGRGWIRFAWAALATGVLVSAGLFGLSRLDPGLPIHFPGAGASLSATPSASSTPTAQAITNPKAVPSGLPLAIAVLNGSPSDGLQDKAANVIKAAGWPDPGRALASDRTQKTTVIYYSTAQYEGIARGLAALLGVGADVKLSNAFLGSQVTIVLGSDYTAQ